MIRGGRYGPPPAGASPLGRPFPSPFAVPYRFLSHGTCPGPGRFLRSLTLGWTSFALLLSAVCLVPLVFFRLEYLRLPHHDPRRRGPPTVLPLPSVVRHSRDALDEEAPSWRYHAGYQLDPLFLSATNLTIELTEHPEEEVHVRTGILFTNDLGKGCFDAHHYYHFIECLIGAFSWYHELHAAKAPPLEAIAIGPVMYRPFQEEIIALVRLGGSYTSLLQYININMRM